MKTIKEIDFTMLKDGVRAFNEANLPEALGIKNIRIVGVKKDSIFDNFVKYMDAVADDEKLSVDLPPAVVVLYNAIYADEAVDAGAEETDEKVEAPAKKTKKRGRRKKKEEVEEDEVEEDEVEEDEVEEDEVEEDEVEDEEVEEDEDVEDEEVEEDEDVENVEDEEVEEDEDVENVEDEEVEEDEVEKPVKKAKTKRTKPAKKKEDAPRKSNRELSEFGHDLSKNTGLMDELLVNGASYNTLMAKISDLKVNDITRHFRRLKRKGFEIFKKNEADKDKLDIVYTIKRK